MRNIIEESLGIDSSAIIPSIVNKIPQSTLIPENNDSFDKNIQQDYEKSREYLYDLLGKMEGLLENSIMVAQQTEHPRAFEVASQLVKESVGIVDQLQKNNKDTQILKGQKPSKQTASTITTNNNSIFVGSTADLSAFLNERKKDTTTE